MVVRCQFILLAIVALLSQWAVPSIGAAENPSEFALTLRHRVPVTEKSSRFHMLTEFESWSADKTAVVVCDVWDSHHCLNAVRRVQEMAPRMNEFLREAPPPRRVDHPCAERLHAGLRRTSGAATCRSRHRGRTTCRQTLGNGATRFPRKSRACIRSINRTEAKTMIRRSTAQWKSQLAAEGRNPNAPWKTSDRCAADLRRGRDQRPWRRSLEPLGTARYPARDRVGRPHEYVCLGPALWIEATGQERQTRGACARSDRYDVQPATVAVRPTPQRDRLDC